MNTIPEDVLEQWSDEPLTTPEEMELAAAVLALVFLVFGVVIVSALAN